MFIGQFCLVKIMNPKQYIRKIRKIKTFKSSEGIEESYKLLSKDVTGNMNYAEMIK